MTENIKVADEQLSKETGFTEIPEPPQAVKPESIATNDLFTSIVHTTFFSPEQCKAIIDACETPLWIQGEVNEGQIDKKLRNTII